jgi:hypothetical protein
MLEGRWRGEGAILAVLTQYGKCMLIFTVIINEVLLIQSQFILRGKPLRYSLYSHTVNYHIATTRTFVSPNGPVLFKYYSYFVYQDFFSSYLVDHI